MSIAGLHALVLLVILRTPHIAQETFLSGLCVLSKMLYILISCLALLPVRKPIRITTRRLPCPNHRRPHIGKLIFTANVKLLDLTTHVLSNLLSIITINRAVLLNLVVQSGILGLQPRRSDRFQAGSSEGIGMLGSLRPAPE